jgi:hypothetical protein
VAPDVVLDRRPGQAWNFARIFPSDTTKQDTSTAPGWGDYLVFRDARVVDGHLTIRTPYAAPDTLPGGARLTAAQKDSALRVALDTASRANVQRVPEGYQTVQEVQRLHAGFPLLRIAHPDYKSRRVEVDSARALAYLFRPPPADIRALRGALDISSDSLWFRDLAVQLPASRATVTGRYDLNSGALAVRGRAAPVSLADARFALPSLPNGTVTADYEVALDGGAQRYVARGLDFRATNPDGSAATATGTVAVSTGPRAGADSAGRPVLRLDSTAVTFANVQTGLVAAFAPGTTLPVAGTASGAVRAAGTLADLQVAADVTFDERRAGRSRVRAEGGVGVDGSTVTARNLRVALEPLQVALARPFAPTLPVGGTLRGVATVDGSTASGLAVRGVDLTHADRTGTSRLTGAVTWRSRPTRPPAAGRPPPSGARRPPWAPGPPAAVGRGDRAVGRRRRGAPPGRRQPHAPPRSLATVGRFAPAAGLRGTVSGPVRVRGALDDLAVDARLAFAGPGGRRGGTLDVAGRVGQGRTLRYDLVATPRDLDAGAITTKAPSTGLTGRIAARGPRHRPGPAVATIEADLGTLRVDTVGVDSVRARLAVAGGLATVRTLAVRAPRATLDAVGELRARRPGARAALVPASRWTRSAPTRATCRATPGAVAPRPLPNARAARRRARGQRRRGRSARPWPWPPATPPPPRSRRPTRSAPSAATRWPARCTRPARSPATSRAST